MSFRKPRAPKPRPFRTTRIHVREGAAQAHRTQQRARPLQRLHRVAAALGGRLNVKAKARLGSFSRCRSRWVRGQG